MDFYVTSHLSNRALRADIRISDLGESRSIAVMLSRIGEYDARKLFVEDGYPSMRAYCMRELRYSEPEAAKRIYAARTARKLPVLFMALADGRLNLSGLVMLARHLTLGNVGELLEAARGKTNEEIAQLIAQRFPRPDLPERLVSIALPGVAAEGSQHSVRNAAARLGATPPCPTPAPEHSVRNADARLGATPPCPAPATEPSVRNADARFGTAPPCPAPAAEHSVRNAVGTPPPPASSQDSPGNPPPPARGRMTPLSPGRFGFQFTGDQETHDEYEKFRERMSHEIPSGEMALVFKAALKIANAQLEKRKFAATDRPGRSRGSASPRCIPAAVKRAVAERDQGRCAFVSESGRRCGSRSMLEYDHIEAVARGGTATVDNVRLLCKAHNQHAAERAFGVEFMSDKRAEALSRARARCSARNAVAPSLVKHSIDSARKTSQTY
jgi:HNH endonuclease